MGAEFLGLQNGAVCEVGTGNTGREAEVVLDLRGCAGLSSRRGRVDHDGGQPFRRCVHGRSQSRRTATDDHQVVDPLRERPSDSDEVGQCPSRGIPQQRLRSEDDHRRVGLGEPEALQQCAYLRVMIHIDPGERHLVPGKEVTDAEGIARGAGPEHSEPLKV